MTPSHKEKFCSCERIESMTYTEGLNLLCDGCHRPISEENIDLLKKYGLYPSPPQNVGGVLEKVDQQVGGALRALGGMKPTPREEEKECVCGHWESRHRPFCDVGDNADKCAEFVSVEKEDEALLKIAEERDLETEFDEKFPAMEWFDCPNGLTPQEAADKIKDWLTLRLKKEREQLARDIHDMKLREGSEMEDEYMCPNCCTPWKCNGPHISDPEQWNDALEQVLALLGESDKYYTPDTKE